MVRAAQRSYTRRWRTRQSRTGRFLLLSIMLHLLFVVALSMPLWTWKVSRPAQKEPQQNPIQVSFVRPENTEEPEKPEVFAETSSRAKLPEAPKVDVANDTKTILPQAQQAPTEPSPASQAQIPEKPSPEAVPPLPPVAPESAAPKVAPKRSPTPTRKETAKASPQSPPKQERKTPEPPEPKRMAKLPEPSERTARQPQLESSLQPSPALEPSLQPERRMLPQLGRVPLLSGEDLEKYAQVRTSDQQSSSNGAVSLDTKELKYLSYFAHIKRRIERAWGYPPEAISKGLQGQLHLKFVVRNDGQVKIVELLRSSGYKVLDKEAWDAVASAGPFEAFPTTIPDDELHITARFTYVLDESAQRVRMR
jgi:periplasmic protein TonB